MRFTLSAAPMFTDGTEAGRIEVTGTLEELHAFLDAEAAKLADGTYTRLGREADAWHDDVECDALDLTLTVARAPLA